MTNEELKEKLKNIDFSSSSAKWLLSNEYKLNVGNKKSRSYYALYLMDEKQCKYDISSNDQTNENYKYAMFVHDDSKVSDSELYIVIGQNPSYSSKTNVDRTNQSIYKAMIHNKKTRYLLLNTFPKIDSDGTNSPDLDKTTENIAIAKQLITELKNCGLTIRLIYACGGSLPVYAKFIEELKELTVSLKIKTYAFEANNLVQAHMSMQNINSKQLKPSDFSIVDYDIDFKPTDEFKHVKFRKG